MEESSYAISKRQQLKNVKNAKLDDGRRGDHLKNPTLIRFLKNNFFLLA
jgi:hypothetical protein